MIRYVRDPGVANTAEEALKILRTWRTAQKRGQEVGVPALGGMERFNLLVKLVSKLEKKHPQFGHRVNTIKYSREARTPTLEVAKLLEEAMVKSLGCWKQMKRLLSTGSLLGSWKTLPWGTLLLLLKEEKKAIARKETPLT